MKIFISALLWIALTSHTSNHVQCRLIQGIYLMDDETWKLTAVNAVGDKYFVFACNEQDCLDHVDEYTFRWEDCDPSEDVIALCPLEGNHTRIEFRECKNIECSTHELGFSELKFKRGKTVSTGIYVCNVK